MNLREIAGLNPNYFEINREERNYVAIFFTALCQLDNVDKFLQVLDLDYEVETNYGVYFEYALMRDLWSEINNEETKKDIIRMLLPIDGIDEILKLPPEEINKKFGVSGEPSKTQLQYPGHWAISKLNKNFPNNDDFLNICRFKWSFNIRPDLVIHLNKENAICIEAKYKSIEGSYPSSSIDKAIFKERELQLVGQMELQKYMMEDLLGLKTDFVFLVYDKENNDEYHVISWAEAFDGLDMNGMPHFALKMVEKISGKAI